MSDEANTDEGLRERIARAIAEGLWPENSWDAEAKLGDLRHDDREECRRAADEVLAVLPDGIDALNESRRAVWGLPPQGEPTERLTAWDILGIGAETGKR